MLVLLLGCSDDKIDSSIISSGSAMSSEAKDVEQNLDKASYAELSDLFLDTSSIDFSKDVLIVFGKNNCKYCDFLKDAIKIDDKLKGVIKDRFNPYYVNISYSKTHKIHFKDKEASVKTYDLASIFSANATPTIVFLNSDGSVKYILPGYAPKFDEIVSEVINSPKPMGDYLDINKKIQNL